MRRATNRLRQAQARPRRVYQDQQQDDYGEGASRKQRAAQLARNHGHQMRPWHRRPNDPFRRWNSFCSDCNAAMVVVAASEPPEGFEFIYGRALHEACEKVRG